MQYLHDPKMSDITLATGREMLEPIDPVIISRRLSQVLYNYLLLSEVYLSAPRSSMDGSPL